MLSVGDLEVIITCIMPANVEWGETMQGESMGLRARLLVVGLVLLASGCGRDSTAPNAAQQAVDPVAAGARKARVCMGCHGPGGVSKVASYPSLAGKDQAYLLEQLQKFKSGERDNPMMNSMVLHLDDQSLRQLAAYFAAQPTPGASHD